MKRIFLLCFVLTLVVMPAAGHRALDAQAAGLMKAQQVLFTENKGQVKDVNGKPVPSVLFTCSVQGLNVYITEQGLTYVFLKSEEDEEGEREREKEKHRPGIPEEVKMEMAWVNVLLEGATITKENIVKELPVNTVLNYFNADLPKSIYGVKQYERITIKDVHPGIDWVLYSSSKGMKYDFILHPGADPKLLRMIYEGEKPLKIDDEGNIHIKTRIGELTENAPVSFTDEGKQIASHFTCQRIGKYKARVTYTIGSYDAAKQLTIDPQLVWGTFIGGNGHDGLYSITHDYMNNIFAAGYTISPDFPVQNNGTFYSSTVAGSSDAFIMKFDQGNNLVWSSYLGGSSGEEAYSITCDPSGNVFITGSTSSLNFPTLNAGTFFQGALANASGSDIFIMKFDNAGTLLWSTYYGGNNGETANSIACDAAGNIFITGYTNSTNLPVQNTGTYFQGTLPGSTNSAYVLKFDNAGNRLWATYYGGGNNTAGYALACDNSGNIFSVGQTNSVNLPTMNAGTFFQGNTNGGIDVYINKFDNNGNMLWATYYGGGGIEDAYNIACSPSGNVYITGTTLSNNFPVQNSGGYFLGTPSIFGKVYILKFDNSGNRLWATLFGGNNADDLESFDDIAIDPCENVYISCTTWSPANMPCVDPGNGSFFDNTYAGGGDCFLAKFDQNDVLLWGTYIGGSSQDFREPLEIDRNNDLYIGGEWSAYTSPAGLPLLSSGAYFDGNPHGMDDSFIMKFHAVNPVMPVGSQIDPTCLCTGSATVNLTSTCALPPYSYEWSTGAQTSNTAATSDSITGLCAGSYWVAITSAAGVDTVYYTIVQAAITVNLTATNVNCSYNDTGSIAASIINGSAPYTYTWSSGGTGAAEDSLSAGTYTVTVTDANGCTAIASDTVAALNPLPVAGFTASDTVLCAGECTGFTNTSVNALTYTWDLGDGVSNLSQSTHCYLTPGNYSVSLLATGAGGCSDTLTLSNYIDVHPSPVAAFTADPLTSTPLSPITFTDQSIGASSWYWSFGDLSGGTSTMQDPVYLYAAAGDHEVVLTVSNSYLCTDTASLSIHIEDIFALYVPNAFTPNGDGLNDEWMPYGTGIDGSHYEVMIFDRWGELIWQNNVWGRGWNGVPDGATKIAQEDVYVWKIAVSATSGEKRNYIGRVTLVK